MFGDVYGVIVEDMTLKKKLLRRLFGQLLEKIGLLFTSTSGHTLSLTSHTKSLVF